MADFLLSEDCVKDIYKLVLLLDGTDDPIIEQLRDKIQREVETKIDARKRRENFSKYKKSVRGTNERENARREYLDQTGIKKDWRTSKETEI